MATCERCWDNAYARALGDTSKDQTEHYRDLLHERRLMPCTPRDQAGQWWDAEKLYDRRTGRTLAAQLASNGHG